MGVNIMAIERRNQLKKIMANAWKLFSRSGFDFRKDFSYYLRLAWLFFKRSIKIYQSNVVGVTFSNDNGVSRQKILQRLKKYECDSVRLIALREPHNQFDSNAIRIDTKVVYDRYISNTVTIGYLNKTLAEEIAPLIDNGAKITLFFTGICSSINNTYIGCSFSYIVVWY